MSGSKIWRRLWNAIAPGTITAINDAGPVLLAQVKIGYLEINDSVPVLQQFGFASTPPVGSDIACFFIGGDRANGVGVGTNHQASRFSAKLSGESAMFNAFGMSVHLSANGIVVNAAGKPVTINGDLHVTGEIVRGAGTADQVSVGTHRHGTGAAAAGTVAPTPGT